MKYFQLKEKIEKENNVEAKCMVVYAIDSKAIEIDLILRNFLLEKFNLLLYYSYIKVLSDEGKSTLVLNRL